jgi:hypothetical protein
MHHMESDRTSEVLRKNPLEALAPPGLDPARAKLIAGAYGYPALPNLIKPGGSEPCPELDFSNLVSKLLQRSAPNVVRRQLERRWRCRGLAGGSRGVAGASESGYLPHRGKGEAGTLSIEPCNVFGFVERPLLS